MQTQTGAKMAAKFLVLFFFATVLIDRTDGTCTFPSDLRGTWRSSRWGDMIFTDSQFTVSGLTDIGTVDMACELQSGTIYVMRSTTSKSVLSNTVDVVTCMDITQLSSYSFYYYHATSQISFLSGDKEPVKLINPGANITTSTACDIATPYSIGTNHMLVLSGSEISAAVQCPDILLGVFTNYTIDKGSGAQCGGVGYITACNNYMNVTVDYSVCSEVVFYSSGGSLECLYSSNNGTTYFVNLYNFDATVDDSSTFRFTCLAMTNGTDDVYATQYPQACSDVQTATSVPSSPYQGGTLYMVANETCVPTTESSDSGISAAVVVVIVLLLLLIIALVVLALYCLWYRKRWPVVRNKLPCFKGRPKGQVEPQVGETADGVDGSAKEGTGTDDGPLAGQQPTMVTTAVVSNEPLMKVRTSNSSRSIVTPSNMQAELSEEEKASQATGTTTTVPVEAPVNPTPRRLPPLDQPPAPVPTGETPRNIYNNSNNNHHHHNNNNNLTNTDQSSVGVEPVYLARPRVTPLEAVRLSEESDLSSDAVTTPPRLLAVSESEPIYQNM